MMFKTKKKLKMYRELVDAIEKIINSELPNDSKIQIIMNTIYETKIKDNLDIEQFKEIAKM